MVVVVNKINSDTDDARENRKILLLFYLPPRIQIMSTTSIRRLKPEESVLLLCDLQARLGNPCSYTRESGTFTDIVATGNFIYGFEEVVATTRKMLKVAKVGFPPLLSPPRIH